MVHIYTLKYYKIIINELALFIIVSYTSLSACTLYGIYIPFCTLLLLFLCTIYIIHFHVFPKASLKLYKSTSSYNSACDFLQLTDNASSIVFPSFPDHDPISNIRLMVI